MNRKAIEVQPVYISKSAIRKTEAAKKDAGHKGMIPWPGIFTYSLPNPGRP
jgi:hypothetical protein